LPPGSEGKGWPARMGGRELGRCPAVLEPGRDDGRLTGAKPGRLLAGAPPGRGAPPGEADVGCVGWRAPEPPLRGDKGREAFEGRGESGFKVGMPIVGSLGIGPSDRGEGAGFAPEAPGAGRLIKGAPGEGGIVPIDACGRADGAVRGVVVADAEIGVARAASVGSAMGAGGWATGGAGDAATGATGLATTGGAAT
jgi:hypothetical protein